MRLFVLPVIRDRTLLKLQSMVFVTVRNIFIFQMALVKVVTHKVSVKHVWTLIIVLLVISKKDLLKNRLMGSV